MKIFFNLFFIIIGLSSCKETNQLNHPSFIKIEKFIESEKRIQGFHINSIQIDRFNFSEYKKIKPNSSKLEFRKLLAFYDLTLKSKNKDYKSKAVVSSLDSVSWEIIKISVSNQTDSISKYFEETITWDNPNSLKPYNVTLKITDN